MLARILALVAVAVVASRVPDPPRWWTDQDDRSLRCFRFAPTGDTRRDDALLQRCLKRAK